MKTLVLALLPVLLLCACSRDHSPMVTVFSPTARELCEHVARCETSITVEECVAEAEFMFERVRAVGCVAQANAANACTIDELSAAPDGGMCDFMAAMVACDAPYRAYTECISAGMEFSCHADHGIFAACYTYRGTLLDPEMTCEELSGVVVTTCPAGEVVGTCSIISTSVELITTYYGPVDAATLDTIVMTCTSADGRWSP